MLCDALCMAVAMDPEAVIKEKMVKHMDVELAGRHTRGQVVIDWEEQGVRKNATYVYRIACRSVNNSVRTGWC